jgi:uncharacterized protein (TIGR03118 family)
MAGSPRFPQLRQGVFFAMAFVLLCAGQALAQHYTRTDLTADIAATSPTAPNLDGDLVNAWGISRSSTSPFWISDNGTGLTTLYTGTGAIVPLGGSPGVTIPTPDGKGTSAPTGTVWNFTKSFEVGPKLPAIFLFVTEDGTISGWNPGVSLKSAVLKVNRSGKAIYKGCALAQTKDGVFLYATNFQTGRVDIFDGNFNLVRSQEVEFRGDDDRFRNYVPFNIQNVGGSLVVTFAHRAPGSHDEDHGAGVGLAGIFDTRLHLLTMLQHGPWFNAPWGVALAPADFGPFSHRLLIGNFGDGSVNAFNFASGAHEGTMLAPDGTTLTIDGLWALTFGSGAKNSGLSTELFFTAGPNDESDGLFGKITATATEQLGNTE